MKITLLQKVKDQLQEKTEQSTQQDAVVTKMKELNTEQFTEMEKQIEIVSIVRISSCAIFTENIRFVFRALKLAWISWYIITIVIMCGVLE